MIPSLMLLILGLLNISAMIITMLKVAAPEFRSENKMFFVFTLFLMVQSFINFALITWHILGGMYK
jgi:hypothetical protein